METSPVSSWGKRTLRQKIEETKAQCEADLAKLNTALGFLNSNPEMETLAEVMEKLA